MSPLDIRSHRPLCCALAAAALLAAAPARPAAARPPGASARPAPRHRLAAPGRAARQRAPRRCRRPWLVQLASQPGLVVRDPRRAYGTPLMVRNLAQVASAHARRFPDARPVRIHDLSRRCGGRLRGHSSHRTGHDVDIRIPQRQDGPYRDATPRTLAIRRTWALIIDLVRSGDVELIFLDRRLQRVLYRFARRRGVSRRALGWLLQYPYRRPSGVVRHWHGHSDHLHVRFRRASAPLELLGARKLCSPPDEHPQAEPVIDRVAARLLPGPTVPPSLMAGAEAPPACHAPQDTRGALPPPGLIASPR